MPYNTEDKISLYQSVSDKLGSAAAELKHFVADADAEAGADNRTDEVEDMDSKANQMSQWAGNFQVLAKLLALDNLDA